MRRTASSPDAAPESALARLLELESRLEAMLDEARRQADATLCRAREQAKEGAGTLEGELAAAESALSASLAAEAAAQIAKEQEALSRVRARYEQVDDRGVEDLAAWLVERVLASVAAEAP